MTLTELLTLSREKGFSRFNVIIMSCTIKLPTTRLRELLELKGPNEHKALKDTYPAVSWHGIYHDGTEYDEMFEGSDAEACINRAGEFLNSFDDAAHSKPSFKKSR